jgi:hypothetical protein
MTLCLSLAFRSGADRDREDLQPPPRPLHSFRRCLRTCSMVNCVALLSVSTLPIHLVPVRS